MSKDETSSMCQMHCSKFELNLERRRYKAPVWEYSVFLVSVRSCRCALEGLLNGSIRSEDAIPFPHPKTQRVSLVLLPFDPHLARAYQFPAIHPESSRLRPQVLLPVRRRLVGLHRGGVSEGWCHITAAICVCSTFY